MTKSQVVVITGASSGIGRATARAFAARGARLVLAARGEEALQLVADECALMGATVHVVPTDVSREDQVIALAGAAAGRFGRIDVWVGGAGVFSFGSFEDTPEDVFRHIIEVNLMGQVYGARAVLPYFRKQGAGTLILIGSLFSRVSAPYLSPYVTSKFGVLGFSEVLRQELRRDRGIRVRTVLPASIDTPIYQHAANYTGREVHALPPVAAPSRVARAIVRSTGRRRPVIVVGRVQASFLPLHSVAPTAYDAVMRSMVEMIGLRGRKPGVTAGTVFSGTAAGEGQITGGWRSPGLRIAAWAAAAGAVAAIVYRRLA
jgi:short-subunit dehydrogenase